MAKVAPREGERQENTSKEPAGEKLPLTDKHLSLEQFLSYWNRVYSDHPKRVIAYLYRRFPRIIKDEPHYIEVYEKPVTREELLGVWGAGDYEIKLNDKDRRSAVCSAIFEFSEPWDKNPPNVNFAELDMSHRRNQSYIQWRESRGMDPKPGSQNNDGSAAVLAKALVDVVNAKTQQPANNTAEATALKSAMDLMGEATKQAISTVKAQQDPAGVSGMLTALEKFVRPPQQTDPLEVLKNAKEIFAGPKQDDTMLKFVLDELKETRRAHNELQAKMLERKEESGDPLAQIEKIASTANALRDAFGGGEARSSGKWGWLQEIGTAAVAPGGALSSILGPVATWGLAKLSGWKPGQAAPGAPPPPGAPPVQAPPPGLPNPNPAPAAAPGIDPQEQFIMDNVMNLFNVIAQPLMKFLGEGRSGYEFADYLHEGGTIDVVQLGQLRGLGREKIMEMLRKHPVAWQFIGPIEARFTQFLDEFLAWEPEQEDQQAA